jgi:hypothetical protein
MRKLRIIIVALTVTTVAGLVFAAIAQSASSAKSQELATAQYANASTQVALRATASAAATAQSAAATAQSAAATAQSATATIQSATMTAQASIMDAEFREVTDLRSQLAASDCASKPSKIDYSSNSSVSNSLKMWLENTYETIFDVRWERVWNNSRTMTYKLTGKYLHVFIVYFDESVTGLIHINAVFDVDQACWLDR